MQSVLHCYDDDDDGPEAAAMAEATLFEVTMLFGM